MSGLKRRVARLEQRRPSGPLPLFLTFMTDGMSWEEILEKHARQYDDMPKTSEEWLAEFSPYRQEGGGDEQIEAEAETA